MTDSSYSVDLGFADTKLPAGTHICQIYNGKDERNDALLSFLLQGVLDGERSACFSENLPEKLIAERFLEQGIPLPEKICCGALILAETADTYFQETGEFDPEYMLDLLKTFYLQSIEEGYPAARVIGEMTSDIVQRPGGSRLLEYESRVSLLVREHPVTSVCQYDASAFDGETIMDILKVHPMMVVRGTVVHNPFYVTPEKFLGT